MGRIPIVRFRTRPRLKNRHNETRRLQTIRNCSHCGMLTRPSRSCLVNPVTRTATKLVVFGKARHVSNRRRWTIVGLLFAASLINYLDRAAISFALPSISRDLHLLPATKGLLLSSFFWSYALVQIPIGWCADRFNLYWLYAGAFAVWSVAQGLTGLATSLTVLNRRIDLPSWRHKDRQRAFLWEGTGLAFRDFQLRHANRIGFWRPADSMAFGALWVAAKFSPLGICGTCVVDTVVCRLSFEAIYPRCFKCTEAYGRGACSLRPIGPQFAGDLLRLFLL